MLKFHNKVCDHLAAAGSPPDDDLHGGATDRDVALPVDGPARFRRAGNREGHRREDSRAAGASSIASRKRRTCRSSSPPRRTGSATAWCVRCTATIGSSRPAASLRRRSSCCSGSPASPAESSATWRRIRRPAPLPIPCCQATGSSTGAASTKSLAAEPRRCSVQSLAQDRSVRRAAAAHAAGRRRQPAVPQSEARRHAGVAVGPGCGQGDGDPESADARRDRDRTGWRGRQEARPASSTHRSGITSSRRRSSAAAASGSVRSGRRSSRKCSSASCRATGSSYLWQKGKHWKPTLPSKTARRVHHGRPAAVRRRHQPDRRHYHGLGAFVAGHRL